VTTRRAPDRRAVDQDLTEVVAPPAPPSKVSPSPADAAGRGGGRQLSRKHALQWPFLLLIAIGVALCVAVARPFFPAFAWALALAVIGHPLHERLDLTDAWAIIGP
jgi:hypothetical protein